LALEEVAQRGLNGRWRFKTLLHARLKAPPRSAPKTT
jgi:hypothetical protein